MKAIKSLLLAAMLAVGCTASIAALAQHAGHVTASAASDTTDGEIRKVDKASGKLTIKHGELKNLGMGAMTMVFRVKDPAMLDKVKAGDKVRMTVDGSMTVTALETVQ